MVSQDLIKFFIKFLKNRQEEYVMVGLEPSIENLISELEKDLENYELDQNTEE